MEATWIIDFQLPQTDFWGSHPTEFRTLYKAWEERENRNYVRAGVIASSIMNTTRQKRNDKIWQATDIFPHLTPKPKKQTPEQMKQQFLAFFGIPENAEVTRG